MFQDQPPVVSNLPINIKKPVINFEAPKVRTTPKAPINDYSNTNGNSKFTPARKEKDINFESKVKTSEYRDESQDGLEEIDSSLVIINNRSKAFPASKVSIPEIY